MRLAEAVPVLDDPLAIAMLDDESDSMEQRHLVIGADGLGRVLVWSTHGAVKISA